MISTAKTIRNCLRGTWKSLLATVSVSFEKEKENEKYPVNNNSKTLGEKESSYEWPVLYEGLYQQLITASFHSYNHYYNNYNYYYNCC